MNTVSSRIPIRIQPVYVWLVLSLVAAIAAAYLFQELPAQQTYDVTTRFLGVATGSILLLVALLIVTLVAANFCLRGKVSIGTFTALSMSVVGGLLTAAEAFLWSNYSAHEFSRETLTIIAVTSGALMFLAMMMVMLVQRFGK